MKNILVVTYWSFNDALIQTYTLPYVKLIQKHSPANCKIYLVTFDKKEENYSFSLKNKIYKTEAHSDINNLAILRFNYSTLNLLMLFKTFRIFTVLVSLIKKKNISHIHSWCTPGGALGYFLSVFTNRRLILDSFEPHAEPMIESKTWGKNSLKFKLLFWLEKKQLKRASKVITCVESMNIYTKEKFNYTLKNYYTKPACINTDHFDFSLKKDSHLIEELGLKDKLVCVYAGKIGGSYLKEDLFQFIKCAEEYWGKDKFRFLFLNNQPDELIDGLISDFSISPQIIVKRFVKHHEIPKYIGLGDFAITPFVPVPSKRYGTPIKTGEYWAMGLPIVITDNISDDSEIIKNENIGYVLKDLTKEEYQNSFDKIDELITLKELPIKIRNVCKKYRDFAIADKVYKNIYEDEVLPFKKILVPTYWSFEDALIQTYTIPYIERIQDNLRRDSKIYLITIEQERFNLLKNEYHLIKEHLTENNINLISMTYSKIFALAFIKMSGLIVYLSGLIYFKRISIIHSWCTPGGAMGYLLSVLTKKKLILDSYEPHAEAMVENGTWTRTNLKFKLLFWLEKQQSKRAYAHIALTKSMKDYAKEKYNVIPQNFYVKPALIDSLTRFNFNLSYYTEERKVLGLSNKIVLVYAGKIGGIYLNEEIFQFIKVAYDFWGDYLKVFLLTTDQEIVDSSLAKYLIPEHIVESKFVPHFEVIKYLQISDFAINPVKPVPTKRHCTSIKDGEYWAMGLPVIITKDISDDSSIIKKHNAGYVLQDLNNSEYLNACKHISKMLKSNSKEEISKKIRSLAAKYRSFEIADDIYKEIYNH